MGRKKVVEHYCIRQEIGRGTFATVFQGVDERTNQELAFKVLPVANLNETMKRYLGKEIKVMRSVNSPYIVKLLDVAKTENNVYLVLELCKGGSIGDYLRKKRSIPLHLARRWLSQIVDAFITLSSLSIAHRDLKADNVLLSSANEEEAVAKVADFGLTRVLDTNSFIQQTHVGSPLFMAPEILQDQMSNSKVDVWSFGILANSMLGDVLFRSTHTKLQLLERQKNTQEDIAASNLSDDIKELLSCTLRYDPSQRPTFEEIRNLRFFTGAPAPIADIPVHSIAPQSDDLPSSSMCSAVDYQQRILKLNCRLEEELGKVASIGVDLGNRNCKLAVIAVYQFYVSEVEKCIEKALQIQQSYSSRELEEFIYKAKERRLCGKKVIEEYQVELSASDFNRSLVRFEANLWIEPRVFKEAADQLLADIEAEPNRVEKLRVVVYLLQLGKENERCRLEAAQQDQQTLQWAVIGDTWDNLMDSLLIEIKAAEQCQA